MSIINTVRQEFVPTQHMLNVFFQWSLRELACSSGFPNECYAALAELMADQGDGIRRRGDLVYEHIREIFGFANWCCGIVSSFLGAGPCLVTLFLEVKFEITVRKPSIRDR